MKTDEIRERFLNFFQERGHRIVQSDSLIPRGDPTLLFTGAGMNQFKDYFLGMKKDLKRACSSQKCLRTGDLDQVGQTAYHHSFFEMLGNFSFGDYFKKEAIEWAWEFLTKELKIPSERLRVSVYHKDEEAYQIWRNHIEVREDSIVQLGDHSNFWPADAPAKGPNGPCGPCSELYFDQGEHYPGALKNVPWYQDESGRFAEIWNLVFTQFDRQSNGSLAPLASKNIDTGAGLERIACILQKKQNNFEIDLFEPMLQTIKHQLGEVPRENLNLLHAIVDHGRAVTFAISDGAFPSNDGRGYVIRKLIRRSVWRARTFGIEKPFLYHIVPAVIQTMGKTYPEIKQSEKNVTQTIQQEEERFLETLEKGLVVLSKLIDQAKNKRKKELVGDDVFLLYDTYGFPDELTRTIAAKEGLTIDQTGYDQLMLEQRKRAKEKSKISSAIFSVDEAKKEISHLPESKFLGYETLEAEGTILWLKRLADETILVLDQTPFYAEGGGQVGDRGRIVADNLEFLVTNTQKREKVIIHMGQLKKGKLSEKKRVKAIVDKEKREATKRNHTATHLLQAVLRNTLGKHVRQVGSFVSPEKLRFDFLHGKALTREEINMVEKQLNASVLENHTIDVRCETYRQATQEGAIAFFGDKYEDSVRVIDVKGISKELCGGTHCNKTGDIGLFLITNESAIASGTRRIEAITGLKALEHVQTLRTQMENAVALLKTTPDQVSEKIEKLSLALKNYEKENKTKRNQITLDVEQLIREATLVGNISVIARTIPEAGIEELRKTCDHIKRKNMKSTVVVLFGTCNEKISLVIFLTKDLVESTKLNASELAKELSILCEGSGGGKKDFAQGGGKNLTAIPKALERAIQLVGKGQK